MLALANHTSGSIERRTEHTFYSEISTNNSGNIGPKIATSLTIQSLTTDDCTDRLWGALVLVLANHSSWSINVVLNMHFNPKFRQTLVEI